LIINIGGVKASTLVLKHYVHVEVQDPLKKVWTKLVANDNYALAA